MTTLTWTGQGKVDANPNDPKNWNPQQKPTANDTAVFPWGTEQLSPSQPWAIGNIVIEGGSNVTFSSIPYVSGDLHIEGGGKLYITASSGDLSLSNLKVDNGGLLISARLIKAISLVLDGGANFKAQNGLDIAVFVDVNNGSNGDVWGPLTICGRPGAGGAHVQPGSGFRHHGGGASCYARGTKILLHGNIEKAVEDLVAGDVIQSGPQINWVGKGSLPVRWVRLKRDGRELIVTSDHLILCAGHALYPAEALIGCGAYSAEYADDFLETEYWHFQCWNHTPVMANGIWSESFLDTDGRTDLETVSGDRLRRRFGKHEAFAPIVGKMQHGEKK